MCGRFSRAFLRIHRSRSTGIRDHVCRNTHTDGICTVYLGNPSGEREELRQISSIDILLANSMLELTRSGPNHMTISDQEYRFVRSFTAFGDTAAIVFSTD